MSDIILYDYWRSSASYRVRIALGLKDVEYKAINVNLLAGGHRENSFLEINPQGLVPALTIDGHTLTQSLAIIDYLDTTRPQTPLLPETAYDKHRVQAISHAIAMEIHSVCNLRVAEMVVKLSSGDTENGNADVNRSEIRKAWMQHNISHGLHGVEALLNDGRSGLYCHGDEPGLIDCCLIPQVYNARRWECDLTGLPLITTISERCNQLKAFIAAHPENNQHS